MNLQIAPIPYEDKTILAHLIQLYRYDSSEFDGHELNAHGQYLYKYFDHQWTDEDRRPLLVRVDGEIAGFVLIRLDVPREYVKLSEADATNVISEFFIMRKFRRRGVGRQTAEAVFRQYPGTWEVRQTAGNKDAYRFWKSVIAPFAGEGAYREATLANDAWQGPVFVFAS